MKSKHRHDLQTNELTKLAARLSDWYDEYGSRTLTVLLVAVVVAAVAIYWQRSSQSERAAGWAAFAACRTAEDYANVADDFQGTEVGAWARLHETENHLRQGIQLMFTDRAAGISDLKVAEKGFTSLLSNDATPDAVRERVLIGLARLRETASDGDLQPATQLYQRLLADFPNSVFKEFAEHRLDVLQTASSQEFYAWFHKQNPKPEDIEKPSDFSATDQPETEKTASAPKKDAVEPGQTITFPSPPTTHDAGDASEDTPPPETTKLPQDSAKSSESSSKPNVSTDAADKPSASTRPAAEDSPKAKTTEPKPATGK